MNTTASRPPIEIETGPKPCATVLLMHGLGADGNDFVPIVREMKEALAPIGPVRFVFPNAPVQPVTINGGYAMPAWYDILGPGRPEDEAGLRQSMATLEGLLACERERGIPSERTVIAGFSQGGAITLHAVCRLAEPLAGAMALSTYLPLHDTLPKELTDAAKATPVLMCHGRVDPVLPLKMGTDSRDGLKSWGMNVEWHDYPMAHAVCAEEIDDISAWLGRVLA